MASSQALSLSLRTVCDALGVVKYKWREIGVQLGVSHHKLKEFEKEDDPLAAIIDYWLCGNVEGIPVSWKSVVQAVKSDHVGEPGLAKRIKQQYCNNGGAANDDKSSLYQESVVTGPATSTTSSGSTFKLPVINLKEYFPYLGGKKMNQLSEEERHFQLLQLDEHTSKMKRTFAGIVFNLQKSIEKESKLDDLVNVLRIFDKDKFGELLSDATTIAEVFSKINPYFSFFDFELVKLLTRNLGSRSNKEKLKKYKKMFEEFSKQRVCECPSDAFGDVLESEENFIMKIDKQIQRLTVEELLKLKFEISKVIGHKLRLLTVEEGCVKLSLRALDIDELIVPNEKFPALTKLHVLSLTYGEFILQLGDEKSTEGEHKSDSGFGTKESAIGSTTTKRINKPTDERDFFDDPELKLLETIDMNESKICSFSPLHIATLKGDLYEVKRIVEEGTNPLNPDLYDDTLLHHAASVGELEILKYLVEDLGCNPAIKGWKGSTPMHSAAQAKQFKIIQYLVEDCKLDPTEVDEFDQFPLHYAYRFGNLDFVHYLMDHMKEYMEDKDVKSVLKFQNLRSDIERSFLPNQSSPQAEVPPDGFPALQLASIAGNLGLLRSLVSKLSHKELKSQQFIKTYNCLHIAVIYGHFPIVRYFVEELKWDIYHRDKEGNDCLYLAIQVGNLDMVKFFIEKYGYDPKRQDDNFYTPVHVASVAGHLPVLKYFIEEKNCDPSLTESSLVNCLHNACHFGHYKAVHYLITKLKMEVNMPNNDGLTPLSIAAIEGHLDIVKLLLKLDDTAYYDRKSRTPMYYAAGSGHLNIVKYLVSHDYELYAFVVGLSKSHSSPLPYATREGKFEVVKYLIDEFQFNPFQVYDNNYSFVFQRFGHSLMTTAFLFQHQKIVKYFLQKVKHIKPKNLYLHYAVYGGLNIFKIFLQELDVHPDFPDKYGLRPITRAVDNGDLEILRYLVEELKIDIKSSYQFNDMTPLHVAASKGYLDIVMYLIGLVKVDPFSTDQNGNTSLHYAARYGQIEVIKCLCKCEVYPWIKNDSGKLPLEIAINAKSSDTTILLLIIIMFKYLTIENYQEAERVRNAHYF